MRQNISKHCSPIFLFLSLLAVLACTVLPGLKLCNLLLLTFSLVFHVWGEVIFGSPMSRGIFECRHRMGR